MVQEVESLRSKLEIDSFSYVCPLHDGDIVIGLERSSKCVPADVAEGGETGARRTGAANDYILIVNAAPAGNERIEVHEVIDPFACAATRQDRTRTDRRSTTIDEVGVLQRERTKVHDQERRAGLERAHTVDGPAVHEFARRTAKPPGKRKLVVVTDHKPVRSIEVRKTFIRRRIQEIAHVEKAVQLIAETRSGSIVDRLTKRIRGL